MEDLGNISASGGSTSEIEEWLTATVGLKGKKLTTCLKAFDEAMVEDLNDIRSMNESTGGLKEILPVFLATMVSEALDPTTTNTEKHTNSETRQVQHMTPTHRTRQLRSDATTRWLEENGLQNYSTGS